ncbi:hypothetical protein GTQ34_04290 [Muricauda sp. JGD-17]|uniref:Uncharacterized protein n=1 Tax=Flagellimonas ochracea TaxID=2696472 RepID=A0A964TBJ5_9FLAO|nr:hypothetical protein [Allomuricauda ochracea]NAY91131.1 hypothetical protein [Allomuricauda ochracea]
MNTKLRLLCALACVFCMQASFPNQCDSFYSKVTYALNHTKKGLSATNFEHQMYYAERALDAIEKGKSFMADCSCEKAGDKTIDVMETLDKAIEPVDWDAGRFFTKKAMRQINELITILDNCTLGISTLQSVEDNDSVKLEHQAHTNTADETSSENSMEMEMVKVFDKHANEKIANAEKAIGKLIELSKTIGTITDEGVRNPNSLSAHQLAYLERARKLLQEGIENLEQQE